MSLESDVANLVTKTNDLLTYFNGKKNGDRHGRQCCNRCHSGHRPGLVGGPGGRLGQ